VDLSCIILSGDLELYVLGMLPEDEAQKISQLILIFPEVKEEVDRISETLNRVARDAGPAPRAEVKEILFNEFRKLGDANEGMRIETEPVQKELAPVRTIAPRKSSGFLLAASVLGMILFAALMVYLFNQNQKNKTEMASLQEDVQKLNTSLNEQKQQNLAYNQMMQIMNDENYSGIDLLAVPGKPVSKAKIYWNRNSAEVFVVDISLPQPPADKQYQLWAIVNGQPVSAGMLEDKKQVAQKMADFRSADAFAITMERKGGSPVPTMEDMYVFGKP
jgi:anti-sigma-K factor RskA